MVKVSGVVSFGKSYSTNSYRVRQRFPRSFERFTFRSRIAYVLISCRVPVRRRRTSTKPVQRVTEKPSGDAREITHGPETDRLRLSTITVMITNQIDGTALNLQCSFGTPGAREAQWCDLRIEQQ